MRQRQMVLEESDVEQFNSFVLGLNNRLQHLPSKARTSRIADILEDVEVMSNGEPSYIFTPLSELCDNDEDELLEEAEAAACDSAMTREQRIKELQDFYSGKDSFEDDEEEIQKEYIVKKRCGNSDLHEAVYMGDCSLIKELIAKGAKPFEKNNNGHSAISIAYLEENDNVISLFKELKLIA